MLFAIYLMYVAFMSNNVEAYECFVRTFPSLKDEKLIEESLEEGDQKPYKTTEETIDSREQKTENKNPVDEGKDTHSPSADTSKSDSLPGVYN